jgi:uncharacterized protein YbjQ (UPF0145 family)
MPTCPNCNAELKSSLLSSVSLLHQREIQLIKEYLPNAASEYCNKCGKTPLQEAKNAYHEEVRELKGFIQENIALIPVVTAPNPFRWEYETLEMVTGQSVTGTGVISEFTSSFTDLFGVQSNRYNSKLKDGEKLCASQLQKQTLDLGGNAVIATDIDYSEVGGDKGMLMVCMSGTAIRLTNIEILGSEKTRKIEKLNKCNGRLQYLEFFNL